MAEPIGSFHPASGEESGDCLGLLRMLPQGRQSVVGAAQFKWG